MSTNEFEAIETLDLAPIKMKLMHVESGEGWSALRADAVEAEYRRFLYLMKKYPDAGASPSVDVDTFWHYHILDTMKYALDCEAVFGYFLHHYPYVGIGANANEGDHAAGGERMRRIYEAEFGAGAAANDAYAFCTAPNQPREAATAASAFCTAPNRPLDAAAHAFCTAPNVKAAQAFRTAPNVKAAYAFCTAPNQPRDAANDAAAFCTAPNRPLDAVNSAQAFCTAPNVKAASAFCTAPNVKAAHAFCTAPNVKATYAFCTAPNQPREAANAAHAFCTAPNQPLPTRADGADHRAAAGQELAHAA